MDVVIYTWCWSRQEEEDDGEYVWGGENVERVISGQSTDEEILGWGAGRM